MTSQQYFMRLYRFISSVMGASALFLALSFTSAHAATITVDTADDELDAGYATHCDPGNESDCSLREAIELSNENGEDDTIILADNTTYYISVVGTHEDNNASGDFDITETGQSLTIQGQSLSTEISGDDDSRIFDIGNSELTLEDLRLANGNTLAGTSEYPSSASSGGAIYSNDDSTLTVTRVEISDNSANAGAAILAYKTSLSITDSEISGNATSNTTGRAGAIDFDANNVTVDLTIDNTIFNGNNSSFTSGCARGLHLGTSGHKDVTMTITNSVFINAELTCGGSSSSAGFDIATYNSSATGGSVEFENVLISSELHGGDAISLSGSSGGELSSADVVHTTLIGGALITNQALAVDIKNSIFGDSCTDSAFGDGFTSGGYNIDSGTGCTTIGGTDSTSTDPEIMDGDFADYGNSANGITFLTTLLDETSPAIDAIPSAACTDSSDTALADDVRGMTRPDNNNCDIGAIEMDQTAPSVSITSNNDDTNTLECSVDTWTDPGATASDTFDTTVSTASVLSGTVDETTPAAYTITYQSEADYDGNQSTLQRTVTVEDTVKPSISTDLSGTTVEVDQDASDSTLEAAVPTVEAADTCDSSLTTSNNVTEIVDSSVPGDYTVTITVADDSGNQDTETFTVTVVEVVEEDGGDEEESEGGDESDEELEEGDTDNDVETGEGDGSEDTEETLGAVVSLTKSTDSMVTVEYEDGSTKTFQLFNASAKAKVQLHTNGAILIAINKTYMRTFNAFTGEQLDQVKLFKKKQYKTKFKRFNVYKKVPGKNNVMVLAQTKQKHKKQFKLRSFVVKNGGAITKRPYRTIELNNNAKFANLSIAKNNKNGKNARILIKKKGKTLKNWKYRVTKKKGIIKKAI